MTIGSRVLDLCAGLGGPARFLAARLGCRVVAVELNGARRRRGAAVTPRGPGRSRAGRAYRAARAEMVARFGEARVRDYAALLVFLRSLVDRDKLGLGRISATR